MIINKYTKKTYYETMTHLQIQEHIDEYYILMDIFCESHHLIAMAVKELLFVKLTPYAIKLHYQEWRIWNTFEWTNALLNTCHKVISKFILENMDIAEELERDSKAQN